MVEGAEEDLESEDKERLEIDRQVVTYGWVVHTGRLA